MSEHLSHSALLAWYAESKRDLPWRHTSDAWEILLSEILLQQTQVSRGIHYWQKVVKRFPTPQSMADAEVDEVLHLWQGAGYYSRARRLHALSVQVCLPSIEVDLTESYPRQRLNYSSYLELDLTPLQRLPVLPMERPLRALMGISEGSWLVSQNNLTPP